MPGDTKADTPRAFLILCLGVVCVALLSSTGPCWADETLATRLGNLDATVLAEEPKRAGMLADDVRARRAKANLRETALWHKIQTRRDWEQFRDARIHALHGSLGQFPPVPKELQVRLARTLAGDGYRIDNLVFESRPGLFVTANLYRPSDPRDSMPGILLCHSHHNPKTQAELQDMGMTWARLGCIVLVMDQLGHGERRQHSFRSRDDYPGEFRVGRQDYHFRYNVGMQLHLIGDSLIGWMVWDLMRGVDLLLDWAGADPQRIILLGSVAGGGDPAAVTAALDRRIAAVVPFNFGGPQPENRYPLPPDAERSFNYAGSGSWESTRNLRLSVRDGFMPWVIVGAVAPRGLIYAHEFAWDHQRDPVWKRLQKIFDLYGMRDRLASLHGSGQVTGRGPGNTHCNNVGPVHREQIYPVLESWFGMPVPEEEYRQRWPAEDLLCLTPEIESKLKPRTLHQLAAELGSARALAARQRLAGLAPNARPTRLREQWDQLFGGIEPKFTPRVASSCQEQLGEVTVETTVLEVEPQIVVPLVLLIPAHGRTARLAVVVGVAQGGKGTFLKERAEAIAELLESGVAVCLPDVRGSGETEPDSGRGRRSSATALSSSELMLGRTLLGLRLHDLRSVLRYLRSRAELDPGRQALWGDSFAPTNPPSRRLAVPLDADPFPHLSEPLGGLLALFGGLFEEDVRAIWIRGGSTGFQSILQSRFCYVPHDIIVPGALLAGDLCDVAAALAPRPLRMDGLVDGLNRRASAALLAESFAPTRAAYRITTAADQLRIEAEQREQTVDVKWLLRQLRTSTSN